MRYYELRNYLKFMRRLSFEAWLGLLARVCSWLYSGDEHIVDTSNDFCQTNLSVCLFACQLAWKGLTCGTSLLTTFDELNPSKSGWRAHRRPCTYGLMFSGLLICASFATLSFRLSCTRFKHDWSTGCHCPWINLDQKDIGHKFDSHYKHGLARIFLLLC